MRGAQEESFRCTEEGKNPSGQEYKELTHRLVWKEETDWGRANWECVYVASPLHPSPELSTRAGP